MKLEKYESYKVVAKDHLQIEGDFHTWTKGLDYEVIQMEDHIKLTSNEGQVNYVNDVKKQVLEQFNVV